MRSRVTCGACWYSASTELEALRIALGLGHDARLVAFGLLLQARGRTDGARNDVVGIGLRLVLGALALLAGLEHVVEGGLHLLGRAHAALLQVDAHDFDADLVAVQDGLHQGAHARRDLVALLGQRRVHPHLAHHLAHRGLGGLHHGVGGVLALEQVGARVVQAVLHGELDLDDVLVLGQHGRFAQAGGLDHGVAADVDGADLRDEHQLMALDRVRQAPVEAGAHGGLVAAELGDHGLLAFLHDEEAGAQPDQHHHRGHQAGADAGALHVGLEVAAAAAKPPLSRTPALAAEQAAQLAVEIAPELVQVGRALVGALASPVAFGLLRVGPVVVGLLVVPPRPQRGSFRLNMPLIRPFSPAQAGWVNGGSFVCGLLCCQSAALCPIRRECRAISGLSAPGAALAVALAHL